MPHEALIGVLRIQGPDDNPAVPSIEEKCADCGEPVFLAVGMRESVRALEGFIPPLVCEVCLPVRLAGTTRS